MHHDALSGTPEAMTAEEEAETGRGSAMRLGKAQGPARQSLPSVRCACLR